MTGMKLRAIVTLFTIAARVVCSSNEHQEGTVSADRSCEKRAYSALTDKEGGARITKIIKCVLKDMNAIEDAVSRLQLGFKEEKEARLSMEHEDNGDVIARLHALCNTSQSELSTLRETVGSLERRLKEKDKRFVSLVQKVQRIESQYQNITNDILSLRHQYSIVQSQRPPFRRTRATTTTTTTTTTQAPFCRRCPSRNWKLFQGSCYLHDYAATFMTAHSACEDRGAHLLTIENNEENDFVHETFGTNFWIGIRRRVDGVWRWDHDRRRVEFTAWMSGHPKSGGDCAYTWDRQWWSVHCSGTWITTAKQVVCELNCP